MKMLRKMLRSMFFISMLILLFALSPPSLFAMSNTQPNEDFSSPHLPQDMEQDNLRIHMVQPTPTPPMTPVPTMITPMPLTPTPTMTPAPTPIPAVSNVSSNSGCSSIIQSGTTNNANCQTQSQSQNQVQNNNQNVTISSVLPPAQPPQPMQQVLAAQTVAPPPQNIQQLPSTGGEGQLLFGLLSLIPIGLRLKKIH